MKTILVSTDFSDAARNASEYAVQLAKDINCKVTLFHAYHLLVIASADTPMSALEDSKELQKINKQRIKEEALILSAFGDVIIDTLTIEGLAVDEILYLEKTDTPDLVVLGMKHYNALSEYINGSVATAVVKKSISPVLIIPENIRYRKIKNIAFACDYRIDTKIDILNPIKEIAELFNSKLYILTVEKEKKLIEVEQAVTGVKIENYFDHTTHSYNFIENDDLIEGINHFAEVNEIDLIVMLPHKHKLLEQIFKSSNTKKMAFHTHIPLLALPDF